MSFYQKEKTNLSCEMLQVNLSSTVTQSLKFICPSITTFSWLFFPKDLIVKVHDPTTIILRNTTDVPMKMSSSTHISKCIITKSDQLQSFKTILKTPEPFLQVHEHTTCMFKRFAMVAWQVCFHGNKPISYSMDVCLCEALGLNKMKMEMIWPMSWAVKQKHISMG